MATNLIEGIQKECERLRSFIPIYESIGPAGGFGIMMIKQDIAKGEAAIAGGDIVEMVSVCKYLQEQDPS